MRQNDQTHPPQNRPPLPDRKPFIKEANRVKRLAWCQERQSWKLKAALQFEWAWQNTHKSHQFVETFVHCRRSLTRKLQVLCISTITITKKSSRCVCKRDWIWSITIRTCFDDPFVPNGSACATSCAGVPWRGTAIELDVQIATRHRVMTGLQESTCMGQS